MEQQDNTMFRFVIPFHVQGSFVPEKNWNKEHIAKASTNQIRKNKPENDLYEYIIDLMNDDNKTGINNDIATSYFYNNQKYYQKRKYTLEMNEQEYHFNVATVGAVVFTTNVVILWYELEFKENLSSEEKIEIIDALKEFNYTKKSRLICSIGDVPFTDSIKIENLKEDKQVNVIKEKNITIEGVDTTLITYSKEIKPFGIIQDIIVEFDVDSFFVKRRHKAKDSGNKEILPDRAIPFSCACDIGKNEDIMSRKNMAWHLGRGYKSTYLMSNQISDEDFMIPFEDSLWYACLEGCSNYCTPLEENSFLGKPDYYRVRINSYFYLYVLCLGQYYSLLQLAQEVSALPITVEGYENGKYDLEELCDRIRVFNLKNNFSQVGHLTQHNDFYKYLQKRLGVNELQNELQVELQEIYEMIKHKQDKKKERRYRVVSIIAGIYAVLQAFVNVAAMYESATTGNKEYFMFASIGCALLAILGVAIWIVWGLFSND